MYNSGESIHGSIKGVRKAAIVKKEILHVLLLDVSWSGEMITVDFPIGSSDALKLTLQKSRIVDSPAYNSRIPLK